MEDGEAVGNESSRFGRRMIHDVAIRHSEKLVRLAETAGVDERGNAKAEQQPLVPRLVGRRDRSSGNRGWAQLLDGLVESAEQVGAARRALDLTVGYTLARVQFGRPIGGFQALQHRMADLHVLVESARSLSDAAAQAAAEEAPDIGLWAAAAKVYCSEALTRVAGEMIQLHGAIGITWEHDAHRYFKRAHGAAQLFGRPAEHVARIAAALVDR